MTTRLRPGYYILPKAQLGKAIPRPSNTMSILAFLRAVHFCDPLPTEICVLGLERLLSSVGEPRRGAQVIQRALYNPSAKSHLRRQSPVVVLPLEYLEHSMHWVAGIRRGGKAQEVFWVEWVFPRVEIFSADVCHSML